jgi:hypothetical protein
LIYPLSALFEAFNEYEYYYLHFLDLNKCLSSILFWGGNFGICWTLYFHTSNKQRGQQRKVSILRGFFWEGGGIDLDYLAFLLFPYFSTGYVKGKKANTKRSEEVLDNHGTNYPIQSYVHAQKIG